MRDFYKSKTWVALAVLEAILSGAPADAVPILQVNPMQVIFDQQALNANQIKVKPNSENIFIKTMLLHNAGNADLIITDLSTTLPLVFYAIDPVTQLPPEVPLVIHAGENYSFDLYYEDRPSYESSPAATLRFISNVPTKIVSILANPTVGKLQLSSLDPDPTWEDFLPTLVGEERWRVYEIKNVGASPVRLLKVSIDNLDGIPSGFTTSPPGVLPRFLSAGQSILLPVSFHPPIAGRYFDKISVLSNRLGVQSFNYLAGCGLSSPLVITAGRDCAVGTQGVYFRDYGNQELNVDWHVQTTELHNINGHSAVDYIAIERIDISITGPDAEDFSIISMPGRGTIFFDQTWPIVFKFDPKVLKAEYHATAQFTFYINRFLGASYILSPITQVVDLTAFSSLDSSMLSGPSIFPIPPPSSRSTLYVGGCAVTAVTEYDSSTVGWVIFLLFSLSLYLPIVNRKTKNLLRRK